VPQLQAIGRRQSFGVVAIGILDHNSLMIDIVTSDLTDSPLDLSRFKVIVCAGGGNRCWWQAGLLRVLADHGLGLPPMLVGTSAGAAIATAWATRSIDRAFESCKRLYGQNAQVFRWRPKMHEARFAQTLIYPEWVGSVLDKSGYEALLGLSSKLSIAVTRPSLWLGPRISVALATLAYMTDKAFGGKLHPTTLARLGLSHEFFVLQESTDLKEAHRLLVAAAAAPPFIPGQTLVDQKAFDGGYVDSMPIDPQSALRSTLILMTRHRPELPVRFKHNGRTYWQPSAPVPVSTWDCTPSATVDLAFQLGQTDASNALASDSVQVT